MSSSNSHFPSITTKTELFYFYCALQTPPHLCSKRTMAWSVGGGVCSSTVGQQPQLMQLVCKTNK